MRRVTVVRSLIVNEESDPKRESSILSLHFRIRKHHVKDARIEVRCKASILNVYNRSKMAEIFVKTHNNAENLATHNHEFSSLAVKNHHFSLILEFWTALLNLHLLLRNFIA